LVNRGRFGAAQLGLELDVVASAIIDVEQLADPGHRQAGLGMVVVGFCESTEHVPPTSRQRDPGARSCSGAVSRRTAA